MSDAKPALRCPRCHRDNDAEVHQCIVCGEILRRGRKTMGQVAQLRRSSGVDDDPAALGSRLHVYDARLLSKPVGILKFLGITAFIVAGVLYAAAYLFLDYGEQLLIAAGATGIGGPLLLTVAFLTYLYAVSRQAATQRLAEVARERTDLDVRRQTAIRRKLVDTGKSALDSEHYVTPPLGALSPAAALRISLPPDSLVYHPLAYTGLAIAALLSFLLLPQYQLIESYSGLRCVIECMTYLLRRPADIMNLTSIPTVLLPVLLMAQVRLAWKQRIRPGYVVSILSLIVMLIMYMVTSAIEKKQLTTITEGAAENPLFGAPGAELMKGISPAVIGFEYGFLLTGMLILATVLLTWLRKV